MATPTNTRSPNTRPGRGATHWTDWINILAGIWLFIAPWAVALGASREAAWNAWIVGLVITVVGLVSLRDQRAEWFNVAAAAWLFFSPWILDYGGFGLAWNAWIVGVIVFIAALAGATSGTRTSYATGRA